MRYLVIKGNYVIQSVEWDGATPYEYPWPHDLIIEDPTGGYAGIGDWYEASEQRFMRYVDAPINGLPEDAPQELQ